MATSEKKLKPPPQPAPPLSTQVKVIMITALVIGGVGFAFGMVSLGMIMGQQPVTNDNDTYNTYNNYTTYNTYYNTTYIYNNATGQRSIYNCCYFEVSVPQSNITYFYNLTLQHKTVLEMFMLKCDGGANGVKLRYNLSINGDSVPSSRMLFDEVILDDRWYNGPESGNTYDLPHIFPNGSNYICQFRITHSSAALKNFQIILGYTVYL